MGKDDAVEEVERLGRWKGTCRERCSEVGSVEKRGEAGRAAVFVSSPPALRFRRWEGGTSHVMLQRNAKNVEAVSQ